MNFVSIFHCMIGVDHPITQIQGNPSSSVFVRLWLSCITDRGRSSEPRCIDNRARRLLSSLQLKTTISSSRTATTVGPKTGTCLHCTGWWRSLISKERGSRYTTVLPGMVRTCTITLKETPAVSYPNPIWGRMIASGITRRLSSTLPLEMEDFDFTDAQQTTNFPTTFGQHEETICSGCKSFF